MLNKYRYELGGVDDASDGLVYIGLYGLVLGLEVNQGYFHFRPPFGAFREAGHILRQADEIVKLKQE